MNRKPTRKRRIVRIAKFLQELGGIGTPVWQTSTMPRGSQYHYVQAQVLVGGTIWQKAAALFIMGDRALTRLERLSPEDYPLALLSNDCQNEASQLILKACLEHGLKL